MVILSFSFQICLEDSLHHNGLSENSESHRNLACRARSERAKDQALEIMRFRHRDQNGMIARLRPTLHNRNRAVRVERRARDNFKQIRFAYMKRTGAGDEKPV